MDHDLKCMCHDLMATRGEGAFSFEYLAEGPYTWQVHVQKFETPEKEGASCHRSNAH